MIWLILSALTALALDAGTKLAAAQLLTNESVLVAGLVELRLTHNTGMALGIFAQTGWASLLLPVAAVVCGALLMRRYRMTTFTAIACGLVLGGFIGNYGQRLLQGYVLDMIYFPFLPWFVCNAADICICLGVALLAFSLLLRPKDWEERKTKDAHH